VTDVIELPDGLHLLKVDARRPAEPIPEADGREPIRAHLRREKARAARDALLERLHAAARIEIVAPLPPVEQIADEKTSPAQRARAMLD
jgi:parvulin-like peptidyl-prolyl isomerase